MSQAIILVDKRLRHSERFIVQIRVLRVRVSQRYPEGIKLIDIIKGQPRLLIDNHAPFGFHIHTDLPENKQARKALETSDYLAALDEFNRLIKEIIKNEN